ncbi:MAG: molybdenum cofactor biosynthesis protein MoaE [Acidobacteriota bacterium]|nr:molybdenum cofactor biosynthesis protein MoaE [Acidobacteriota bacterium]
MRIRVVAFASAAEVLGGRQLVVDQPEGTSVKELLDSLEKTVSGFGALRPRLAVAVDGHLANTDEVLTESAEVALLPPVSGGNDARSKMLTPNAIDVRDLLQDVSDPACGAQVLFVGRVRSDPGGPTVTRLHYEAYEPMASRALEGICRDLMTADSGLRMAVLHRLGEVPLGEASVAIVTAAPHRAAAYKANRIALERLKHEVPIWKLESFEDGSSAWREEEPLATGF